MSRGECCGGADSRRQCPKRTIAAFKGLNVSACACFSLMFYSVGCRCMGYEFWSKWGDGMSVLEGLGGGREDCYY